MHGLERQHYFPAGRLYHEPRLRSASGCVRPASCRLRLSATLRLLVLLIASANFPLTLPSDDAVMDHEQLKSAVVSDLTTT
jgi:hypothetical protein